MIGVDTDQSADSDTIITSAKKDLTDSVYQAVKAFYAGAFPGGSIANLGVAEDGVSLEIANARFQSFSSLEYYTLLGKMIENSVTVRTVEDVDTPLETLVGSHVTIILEDE